MNVRKAFYYFAYSAGLIALGLVTVCPKYAQATIRYFDVNGTVTGSGVTSNGSYSWECNCWNTNNTAGTPPPTPWTEGDFPVFSAGTDGNGLTYTVTANSNHTVAGMQLNASGGANVNINTAA